MKVIKDMSEDIENILDMAECNIKKAIEYQLDFPIASQAFYTESVTLMNSIKGLHDTVMALIEGYKKEKGEPPAPMMAIYNYMHERNINKAAAIKNLQDMYTK